jgi:hypothetical protein
VARFHDAKVPGDRAVTAVRSLKMDVSVKITGNEDAMARHH